MEKQNVNVQLEPELREKLEKAAKQLGLSMSAVIRLSLKKFFNPESYKSSLGIEK